VVVARRLQQTMALVDAPRGQLIRTEENGVRPFDIGRDLRPVAELIADAFTNELDPRGKAALREMRIMSRLSGLIKLLNRGTGELDDVFGGFVWVDRGRVVGNVTVQRADKHGSRWQIANVAVAPQHRGRGIARMLMRQALEHVDLSGGEWAVLQVYEHNAVALKLYESLDFEQIGATVTLRLDRLPRVERPEPVPGFSSFSAQQWLPVYELAASQLNGHAQWWRPVRRADFDMPLDQQAMEWFWQIVGRRRVYRRCIQTSRRFEAALVLFAQRWSGAHEIDLWVRPEQYGRYEAMLTQWALAALWEHPRAPVTVNLSREHTAGLEALEAFGFRPQRTLITMRRRIDA